ncbi:hypothetical protein [Kaistia sp. MMO-174]|uniref:hypothetical protein n=1 Tax=Kaistia sp. MMO-174 TaxID=3081256 RepID=UPI003018F6A5
MTTRRLAQSKAARPAKAQPTIGQSSTAAAPSREGSTDDVAQRHAAEGEVTAAIVDDANSVATADSTATDLLAGGDESDRAAGDDRDALDAGEGQPAEPIVGDTTQNDQASTSGAPAGESTSGDLSLDGELLANATADGSVVLGVGVDEAIELIAVLVVTGPLKGARRAGLRFGPEPMPLPISILRQEEIDAIESDPRLSTRREQRPASTLF